MRYLRRLACALGLAAALCSPGVAVPAQPALATVGTTDAGPGQFYGYPWGGVVYVGPDLTSPYAGSVGYPYYRYGAYYGSGYGLPYPVYPSYGAYYGGPSGPPYPYYPSAGGVSFGDGGFTSLGRCLYSSLAGIGGSWSDPQSYGYYAPYC